MKPAPTIALPRPLIMIVMLVLAGLMVVPSQAAPRAGAKASASATVEGTVTRVTDGDSLWFTPAAGSPSAAPPAPLVVRLRDIDAPEICQPYGEEARRALAELALNQRARLHPAGRDVHGRLLGVVVVDGADLGVRMVEEGHAWSIRTKWDQGPLVKQERMARALSRGLHAGGGAVMPRDFRQSHGPCQGGEPVAAPMLSPAVPPAPPPASPTKPPAARPAATISTQPPAAAGARCDGRLYCSQMRTCDEARWFLTNCPGVHMDGDHDGVPCEAQWCGSGRR